MPYASDPAFLTLHVLRVRGITSSPEVAAATGLDETIVVSTLEAYRDQDLVALRSGALPGWALTRLGRDEDTALAAKELDDAHERDSVAATYAAFLELNPLLLRLCTDWQLLPPADNSTPPELNRHDDASYDAEVLVRLGNVDAAVQPLCARLADGLARFAPYGRRLAEARRLVESGDHDWMTKPMIDSYHAVWFELHEDLLATLGIERGSEPAVEASEVGS